MQILLTGSTGRLGGAFLSLYGGDTTTNDAPSSRHHARPALRRDLDLSSPQTIKQQLETLWNKNPFDAIINPAAISGLEECLDQPDLAHAVNVKSPQMMAEFCQEKNIQMVHFSTDYVFDGQEKQRKVETDQASPINVYGATKRKGEIAVLSTFPDALIARVSWLFGPSKHGKPSHFDNALTKAKSKQTTQLISDKYSVPTSTYDIVHWVSRLIEVRNQEKNTPPSPTNNPQIGTGIYHMCNVGDPESWLSYAQKICSLATSMGFELQPDIFQPIHMEKVDFFREKRPIHTAMHPKRMIDEGILTPRHWLEAAKDYLKHLKNKESH